MNCYPVGVHATKRRTGLQTLSSVRPWSLQTRVCRFSCLRPRHRGQFSLLLSTHPYPAPLATSP